MLLKLITFLGLALAVWSLVRRVLPPTAAPPPAAPRVEAEDLARCPRCGAWGPAGEPCACETPPVP